MGRPIKMPGINVLAFFYAGAKRITASELNNLPGQPINITKISQV